VATSTTEPAPAAGARVEALDAVRGFALLGILLMNSEFFARPLQGVALGVDPQWQGLDRLAGLLVATFVQGKFWTLFSLLFGVGFAVLGERAGERFDSMFRRRLAVLLAIGLAHAFLVWAGDILVPYAVAGFGLWIVARCVPATAFGRAGVLLYCMPLLPMWTSVLALQLLPSAPRGELAAQSAQAYRDSYEAAAHVYADGSFVQVTAQRIVDSLLQYSWFSSILPGILGLFLIGAWLWRTGCLREPAAHRAAWRRTLAIALPLGAPLAVVGEWLQLESDPLVLTPVLALGATLSSFGNLALCAAYGSGLLLLVTRPASRLAPWLAPAGRLSLSNYLAQSLVFTALFYGYGFGLWGEIGRAAQIGLACAFFTLQLLVSRAWLAHFRIGPVEWLWRAAAWLRWPALRR
jgi:uncharacterized protein